MFRWLFLLLVVAVGLWFFWPVPARPTKPPSVKLAPEGIFFLTEYVSISNEDGVCGFPAGTKVTRLEDLGDSLRVRNSTGATLKVLKQKLTNDLDIAETASRRDAQVQKIAVSTSLQKKAQFETEQDAIQSTAVEATSRTAQTQLVRQIEALKQTLSVWDARIFKAQSERANKDQSRRYGYYQNGYNRKGRVTSLSANASQVDALIATRDKLRAQLSQLESQR